MVTSVRLARFSGPCALFFVLAFAGCGGTSDRCSSLRCAANQLCDALDGVCKCGAAPCGSGELCTAAKECVLDLPSRCGPGTQWSAGTPIFREETDAMGLRGVEGLRISVGDIDGDGYADLAVRRAGSVADNFNPDGGVRGTWLLKNEGGQRFTDITQASGLVQTRNGTDPNKGRPAEVIVFADVDNDGHLDVFTGMTNGNTNAPATETSELLLGDGTGHFRLGPASSPLRHEGEFYAHSGASFVDVDRDGKVDLWLGQSAVDSEPAQNQLFLGAGDGNFEDITDLAGLSTQPWGRNITALNGGLGHTYTWSTVACDLNGDGVPELMAGSYARAPDHLWQGRLDGDGIHYTNRSVASGYAFDAQQDWRDNESARCWCKLHPTAVDCTGVPAPRYIQCTADADAFRWNHASDREPWRLGGNSGTTVCADINNDGKMDLLTTEIKHWDVGSSSDASELLINTGEPDVRFARPGTAATGLTRRHSVVSWDDGDMTAAVFDFDNDGRPDLYIGSSDYPGTRGHLFWQKPDGTFLEVPITDGIDHKSSHGIAVADFNRDGALDVLVGHSRARCTATADHCYPTANVRYFRNIFAGAGNWIQLSLEGANGVNRSAIGARVSVKAGDITQTQEVGGGHGHYGIQQDMTLHFGLGPACQAEVTVRWPDQNLTTQKFTVQTGYRYKVVTGGRPSLVAGGTAAVDGGTPSADGGR